MQQTVIKFGNREQANYGGLLTIFHCNTKITEKHVTDESGADHQFAQVTVETDGYLRVSGSTGEQLNQGVRITPNSYGALVDQGADITSILYHRATYFELRQTANEDGSDGSVLMAVAQQDSLGKFVEEGTPLTHYDVGSGPRCTEFRLRLIGGGLAQITATFVFSIVPCQPDQIANEDQRILHNKWSVRDSIDKDFYTTRTYSGRLRVSTAKVSPNLFRGACMPYLPPGMRWQSMEFEASMDGLSLSYTLVQKEAPFSAPKPATSWELQHTETTGDAKMCMGNVNVTLKGPRNVNKKELIAIGILIVKAKLLTFVAGQNPNGLAVIQQITITDYTSSDDSARILVSCDVLHARGGENLDLDFVSNRLGETLTNQQFGGTLLEDYDPTWSPDPPGADGDNGGLSAGVSGPISLAGALATYLQSNCDVYHDVYHGQKADISKLTAAPSRPSWPPVLVTEVEQVPDELPPFYSVGMAESAYTHYQVQSRYETRNSRIALPIASRSSGGDYGDTIKVAGLGRPITMRIIRIKAERIGAAPIIQEPQDEMDLGSPYVSIPKSFKLLKTVALPTYTTTIEGKTIYVVDVEYHYVMSRALELGDSMVIGIDASIAGSAKSISGDAFTSLTESGSVAAAQT